MPRRTGLGDKIPTKINNKIKSKLLIYIDAYLDALSNMSKDTSKIKRVENQKWNELLYQIKNQCEIWVDPDTIE